MSRLTEPIRLLIRRLRPIPGPAPRAIPFTHRGRRYHLIIPPRK